MRGGGENCCFVEKKEKKLESGYQEIVKKKDANSNER